MRAWRREFIGKRQIELAESVLAMFYEAEDAIREIRNPFSMGDEGKTREPSLGETEAEAQLYDRAHVVFERYQKRYRFFAELRSMKYRFMAVFGTKAGVPFEEMNKILRDIFVAARMLGSVYWQRQGRIRMSESAFKQHLEEMYRLEAVFWFMGEENDDIGKRMRQVVEQVEEITRQAAGLKASAQPWYRQLRLRLRRKRLQDR